MARFFASLKQGDLRLSGFRQARSSVTGLTEGSLQISGRNRYPLCQRRHKLARRNISTTKFKDSTSCARSEFRELAFHFLTCCNPIWFPVRSM
ncbi:hypothetical protein PoB_001565700 [Plakobranchus ocellatus]|uniref:Uncharacterized protein n=1 Tax=Plakobranchus ocellatus TaxID=259542 RepID=A0AAV3Z3R2_9GAST|nr:hypothetical protein PoB_001565700 [Plakobranchus ocellatus]